MTVLTMSASEVSRFDTLMRLDRGEIRPIDAMVLLKLGRSQLYRLLKRMQKDGAAGLVSCKRGQPSNRRFSDTFRDQIIAIVRERYLDFGPTLACEYLAKRHGISVSHETLLQITMAAGLWGIGFVAEERSTARPHRVARKDRPRPEDDRGRA